jgi:hypothetical protein
MMLFKDWRKEIDKMNVEVAASKAKCRPFTEKKFLTGLAILIGAAEFAKRGSDLEKIMRFSAAVYHSDRQPLCVLCTCSVWQRYVKEVVLKHL